MTEAERIRRATRRAEEAAKAQIDALAATTARQVEALVERLTGAFIGSDTPEFQAFMAAFQAQQEAALLAISRDIEKVTDEAVGDAEEDERKIRENRLEELGFSQSAALFFSEIFLEGQPYNQTDSKTRVFFSAHDLERAISGGMPIEYIQTLIYDERSGLLVAIMQ